MKKDYQTATSRARTSGRTTPRKARVDPGLAAEEAALALPATVTVAIADLVGELQEGLLAFVVGAGLKVVHTMIEICRDHSTNVKRWRDGQMALRWCAAGMLEAKKQFRRVNGHLHLPALRTTLDAHVTTGVKPDHYATKEEEAA